MRKGFYEKSTRKPFYNDFHSENNFNESSLFSCRGLLQRTCTKHHTYNSLPQSWVSHLQRRNLTQLFSLFYHYSELVIFAKWTKWDPNSLQTPNKGQMYDHVTVTAERRWLIQSSWKRMQCCLRSCSLSASQHCVDSRKFATRCKDVTLKIWQRKTTFGINHARYIASI